MTKLYREFATQEEIDAAYNPTSTVADPDAMFRGLVRAQCRDRGRAAVPAGRQYGPTRAEYCDVFPAGEGAPIHVFVHGGYWRRFSARDHAFVARPLVAAGITTVVMNYALCPSVTLDEIVRQTRASDRLGLRARRRVRRRSQPPHDLGPLGRRASGRHGGGHRLGRRLRPAGGRREGDRVASAASSTSGSCRTAICSPRSRRAGIRCERLSPQRHLPRTAPPLLIAVGGDEPAEFRRQSRDYHAALGSGRSRQHLSRAGRQEPPDRARGAGAARQRPQPGAGPRRARALSRRTQWMSSASAMAARRCSIAKPDWRAATSSGASRRVQRSIAAGSCSRASARDDHRTVLVGVDQVAVTHRHAVHRRPRARTPRHAPRRGSGRRSRRGAGSRWRSCRGRGSSRW